MGISASEARHLMRRAGFGALDANVAHLTTLERGDAVDAVISEAGAPLPHEVPGVGGLTRSEGQRLITDWWVGRMVGGAAPIVEKMVLFWHSHFACTLARVKDMELMRAQHLIFREHALGDFHDLLYSVSFDPAMLIDLDNASNVAGEEQENFARELMELYTIGNGNFTEDEVVDMARAWTGYGIAGEDENRHYHYSSELHDHGQKTLFGTTTNWKAPETITALVRGVRAEATAQFLARKLWRYFGDPGNVPAAVVDHLAQVLLDNNMVVKPALRALFLRDEFWEPHRRYGMVKPPIAWMAELRRRTGVALSESRLVSRSEDLGQELFYPPSVAGWGHNSMWLSSTTLLTRARVARDMRNDVQEAGVFAGIGSESPSWAADRILSRFGVPDASTGTRDALIAWHIDASEELNDKWMEREAFRVGAMIPEMNLA